MLETKEILLTDIEMLDQNRAHSDDQMTSLMQSINDSGLINPVTGYVKPDGKYQLVTGHRRFTACFKLGRKTILMKIYPAPLSFLDTLIQNYDENEKRQDITVWESGQIFWHAQKECRLTVAEIATRFNTNEHRVKTALILYEKLPEEFRGQVVHVNPTEAKRMKGKGKISASNADLIIKLAHGHGLNSLSVKELLFFSKNTDVNTEHVRKAAQLLANGFSPKEAFRKAKDADKFVQIRILLTKEELVALKKRKNLSKYVAQLVKNDLKNTL